MNRSIDTFLFGQGKYYWMRHLLFWIAMYLDEVAYIALVELTYVDYLLSAVALSLDLIIVYISLYFFFKWFFLKKKYISFVLSTLLLILINVTIAIYISYIINGEVPYLEECLGALVRTLTLVSTAIGLKIGKYYYKQLEATQELQASQSKLELNSLREQINPHFLFNVLNTINVQSINDPASVSETVINLSDLLRYQIYEVGASDVVILTKEVSFLKSYLELEKMRRSNLSIDWKELSALPKAYITPFLFLPLVENAVKHSVSIEELPSSIDISWNYENKLLTLIISNSIGNAINKSQGGFGIANLKKRLSLLYPNNYKLEMISKNKTFFATLQIHLK